MTGRLILLCGRSFSGKSTVASSLARSLPGLVVSLDVINQERGLDGGEGIPLSEWARTNELAKERVGARLCDDETVILDDTSSPRFLSGSVADAVRIGWCANGSGVRRHPRGGDPGTAPGQPRHWASGRRL